MIVLLIKIITFLYGESDMREILMETKYEITNQTKTLENGVVLHRIKALKTINGDKIIKVGELGGWVEGEYNLSQNGTSWIHDDSCVYDDAQVLNDAQIFNNSKICDSAIIKGKSYIFNGVIGNNTIIGG